ncbi:YtfJ family protein [Photobacterium sagamiensis]|uniref:YtfJ family protein n=1 Tax=Photobacterium sagamiensis TaxID=2910241 RepID=UPI003D0A5DCC
MSNVIVGQALPEFEIIKGGVATESGSFEAWGTDVLEGKATYFVANAGHPEANEIHNDLTTKISEAGGIRKVHIINAKDAPMGASMFIKAEFKKAGKGDPENSYILDSKGVVAKELGMEKKSALIAVLDAKGVVVFAHEGAFDADVEAKAMEAIASVK